MYVVEIAGVSKSFGGTVALQKLSLKVEKGVFGLIGPNGAGKTTAIRVLLNLIRPDEGEARILGYECQSQSLQVRSLTGVLLEKPSFPVNVMGVEFLSFVGRIKGLSSAEASEEALKLLRWVGLEGSAKREIGGYSAGMRQRLGLAQAVIGGPELVLLDEPTSNLDPLARMRMLNEVQRMSDEQGISFFISSHVLPELELVCDQVGILHNGVLVDRGDVRSLTTKYPSNVFKVIVSDNALLLQEVMRLDFVEEAHESMGAVVVKVKDAEKLYKEVARLVHENSMGLKLFQPLHSPLAALYRASVGGKVEEGI